MAHLQLEPLARLASHLVGEPVRVVWRDLTEFNADGRAGIIGGALTIELDTSLGTWKRDSFSSVFYHELAHVHYQHYRGRVSSVQAEREADALGERFSERCGAALPWRLAHSSSNWEAERFMLPRFAEFAAELRAERSTAQPIQKAKPTMPAAGTRQTYTRTVLEAEYRAGALERGRQMMRGTVESMIARSLGLPNGEGNHAEWATIGGTIRAAR